MTFSAYMNLIGENTVGDKQIVTNVTVPVHFHVNFTCRVQ